MADSKDAESSRLYQTESLLLTARQGDVSLNVAYRYSDFSRLRPNSYANLHRLSQAAVSYETPGRAFTLTGGREFIPLAHRHLFYDGGRLTYSLSNRFRAECFGGYKVPDVYDGSIYSFDEKNRSGGLKLRYAFLPGWFTAVDALTTGDGEQVSAGLQAGKQWARRGGLLGSIVYDQDREDFSYLDVSGTYSPFAGHTLLLNAGRKSPEIDTLNWYDSLFNEQHDYFSAGYTGMFATNWQLSLHYGLIKLEDYTGHLVKLRTRAYGAHLTVEDRRGSQASATALAAGYGYRLMRILFLRAGGRVMLYKLSDSKDEHKAYSGTAGADLDIVKDLKLTAEYEYLQNHIYRHDHRVYVNLRYRFFTRF
jgi:opacity protein-like surface antigen